MVNKLKYKITERELNILEAIFGDISDKSEFEFNDYWFTKIELRDLYFKIKGGLE